MKAYTVTLDLLVSEYANFIESDPSTTPEVLQELIAVAVYDIDDIELLGVYVEEGDFE